MAFDFSLTHGNNFTPIRPERVERLFSPCLKTSPRVINDITYRIPTIPKTPAACKNLINASGIGSPPDINDKFPRHSTGLKPPQPPLCSTVNYNYNANESILSNKDLQLNDGCKAGEDILGEGQMLSFQPYQQLKEDLPIRSTCFHPSGEVYAVGSNSKTLRLCAYPDLKDQENFASDDSFFEPDILYSFVRIHRGSVYCCKFNQAGNLLASGSNDQTVHIVRYNHKRHQPIGCEYKFSAHRGKVRDICFLEDGGESSCLLASAGSGDNGIYLTDCKAMKRVQTMFGHKDSVMSLYCWAQDSSTFVSGSLDGVIKFWDARTKRSVTNVNGFKQQPSHLQSSPVGVVRVDPTGRLLVAGYEDGKCMLYDIRKGKQIQSFQAHSSELRALNFSPKSYYLLTAGYDGSIKLMDLQGDLSKRLPCVDIAKLNDKIIQSVWHPEDYSFVTTSADGLATLWMMPDSISDNNS